MDLCVSNNSALISLNDVHLTLKSEAGDVNILRGINLEVAMGEAVGVMGPSGGGKSTMLMAIAGLEKISSGILSVSGKNLNNFDEDELAVFRRKNVGIIFQDFHLIPTMSALENVAMPLELDKDKQNDSFELASEQLQKVGLGDRMSHYPSQLSGGEQQRVAVARAFVSAPKILLADEPTGNLDKNTGNLVVDLIFDLKEQADTTLLLISHDTSLAARCDRVLTLADGQIEKAVKL